MKNMLTLKAVHDFPVNDKIDEEYVRSFVEWDEKTPTGIGDAAQVEKYARLFAIEKAGMRPYYQELIRPQVEAIRAKVLKEYNEWHASEDYQWLRNYLLTNTNGSVEEIEKLISPNHSHSLKNPPITRERYANWLWNTRHYFGLTHDLETVLEMGAIAQQVEFPDI